MIISDGFNAGEIYMPGIATPKWQCQEGQRYLAYSTLQTLSQLFLSFFLRVIA
jgi:hypothetical protein